jgi:large subunit ribosomal protein L9
MQVVLLERIEKLGQMGDVVTVKDGYGRNYLVPHGKALRATKTNLADFARRRVQLEAANLQRREEASKLAAKIDGRTVVIIRQAGEAGQLYGSVNARDVAAAFTEGGVTMERRQVQLPAALKTLGIHRVRIRLHPEVAAYVLVNVARTPEEAEIQADPERAAAFAAEQAEQRAQPMLLEIPPEFADEALTIE